MAEETFGELIRRFFGNMTTPQGGRYGYTVGGRFPGQGRFTEPGMLGLRDLVTYRGDAADLAQGLRGGAASARMNRVLGMVNSPRDVLDKTPQMPRNAYADTTGLFGGRQPLPGDVAGGPTPGQRTLGQEIGILDDAMSAEMLGGTPPKNPNMGTARGLALANDPAPWRAMRRAGFDAQRARMMEQLAQAGMDPFSGQPQPRTTATYSGASGLALEPGTPSVLDDALAKRASAMGLAEQFGYPRDAGPNVRGNMIESSVGRLSRGPAIVNAVDDALASGIGVSDTPGEMGPNEATRRARIEAAWRGGVGGSGQSPPRATVPQGTGSAGLNFDADVMSSVPEGSPTPVAGGGRRFGRMPYSIMPEGGMKGINERGLMGLFRSTGAQPPWVTGRGTGGNITGTLMRGLGRTGWTMAPFAGKMLNEITGGNERLLTGEANALDNAISGGTSLAGIGGIAGGRALAGPVGLGGVIGSVAGPHIAAALRGGEPGEYSMANVLGRIPVIGDWLGGLGGTNQRIEALNDVWEQAGELGYNKVQQDIAATLVAQGLEPTNELVAKNQQHFADLYNDPGYLEGVENLAAGGEINPAMIGLMGVDAADVESRVGLFDTLVGNQLMGTGAAFQIAFAGTPILSRLEQLAGGISDPAAYAQAMQEAVGPYDRFTDSLSYGMSGDQAANLSALADNRMAATMIDQGIQNEQRALENFMALFPAYEQPEQSMDPMMMQILLNQDPELAQSLGLDPAQMGVG